MTNPTPSAEERARSIDVFSYERGKFGKIRAEIAEQIRQAEQAARADERRKTLEEAAQIAEPNWRIANEIRALTNESGEPGEAA